MGTLSVPCWSNPRAPGLLTATDRWRVPRPSSFCALAPFWLVRPSWRAPSSREPAKRRRAHVTHQAPKLPVFPALFRRLLRLAVNAGVVRAGPVSQARRKRCPLSARTRMGQTFFFLGFSSSLSSSASKSSSLSSSSTTSKSSLSDPSSSERAFLVGFRTRGAILGQ